MSVSSPVRTLASIVASYLSFKTCPRLKQSKSPFLSSVLSRVYENTYAVFVFQISRRSNSFLLLIHCDWWKLYQLYSTLNKQTINSLSISYRKSFRNGFCLRSYEVTNFHPYLLADNLFAISSPVNRQTCHRSGWPNRTGWLLTGSCRVSSGLTGISILSVCKILRMFPVHLRQSGQYSSLFCLAESV